MTAVPSVVKSMFFGEINENDVFPFPHFNTEQKEFAKEMIGAINKFAEGQIDAAKFDLESAIPDEVLKGLAELGLYGLAVSEAHGGMELDHSLYSRVFEEISGIDGSIATTLGAHQSIGFKALLNEGTDEQKQKWLPKLASGEEMAAFCLTEPGSGSDAYSIKTKAIDNKDGTYTINGQKLWITNGGRAEFYTVFCKTDHEIKGEIKEQISCFVVEKSMEGVSFGEKEDKMGIKASETRAVYFDNVKVPKENLIGEAGQGFKIAMNVLNTGRLSLGSGSVGGMKAALELATKQAIGRKQFGSSISEFGLIQEKLSSMACNIYAAESMVYLTTGNILKGMEDFAMESAVCKVFCSEKLWDTVDQAMQIAAGNGYMKEYPYERIMRDARINLIFEGTNEILRCFIALMGIKEPGEKLKELGKITDITSALSDPIKSLGVLSSYAKDYLGKRFGSRTLTMAHSELETYAGEFSSMLTDFSIKVEGVLMKYGKKIIGNELPQLRIANMVIELYASLAVLSRTTAILNDDSVSQEDKDYVLDMSRTILMESKRRFHKNYKRLDSPQDKNIPSVSKAVCAREGYGLDIANF